MPYAMSVVVLLSITSLAQARQSPGAVQQDTFAQGNVNRFLEHARSNARPAMVLFNFDLESG